MKKLIVAAVIVIAACVVFFAGGLGKDDLDGLGGGTWFLVATEENGQKRPVPPQKGFGWVFAQDNKVAWIIPQGKAAKEIAGAFHYNPAKQPKEIDISKPGDPEEIAFSGIYEIKGDQLILCVGEPGAPRPKQISSKAQTVLFFKRLATE